MTTFEEARQTILECVATTGIERVQLLDAVGRVMATEFVAPRDLPRLDKAAMDGFAVRSADCAPGATLTVTDYIAAGGLSHETVQPGCAARIMTGAPVPPGADAVVPFEDTEYTAEAVQLRTAVKNGDHIRSKGSEVATGNLLIAQGTLLGPQQVGLLATFGRAMVQVYKKPRVALISTGDELVELGAVPGENETVNSNAFALAAAVKLCGAVPVIFGIARDDSESHRALLSEGLQCEVLVTSAGVSAGDRDLVRETLAALGVQERFWKVAMRPGGATAFGMKGKVPVFSLPGSPGATMIAFEELVRPAILKMMGHDRVLRRNVRGYLKEDVRKKAGVLNFLGVQVTRENGRYLASPTSVPQNGSSHRLHHYNSLAVLPAGRDSFAAGEEVDLHILDQTIEMEA